MLFLQSLAEWGQLSTASHLGVFVLNKALKNLGLFFLQYSGPIPNMNNIYNIIHYSVATFVKALFYLH